MTQLGRRQKLLNIFLGTLFAIGIEIALLGLGRIFAQFTCLACGLGMGVTVGIFTDPRTGFFSGLLAWGAAISFWMLRPAVQEVIASATRERAEDELNKPWTRVAN